MFMDLSPEEVALVHDARVKALEALEAKTILEPFKALIARWNSQNTWGTCDGTSSRKFEAGRDFQASQCADELRALLLAEASKRDQDVEAGQRIAEDLVGAQDELRRFRGILARLVQDAYKFIHNVDLYLVDCQGLIRLNVARKEFADQLKATQTP